MGTLKEDIKTQSDWIVKAFNEDNLNLDYSIKSLVEIDKFFQLHSNNGQPIKGGRLSKNLGLICFSLASYIGETFIKNVPESTWKTDDEDPQGEFNLSIELPNGTECFPAHRVMKRLKNGLEDGIYPYGHQITKDITGQEFDKSFWAIQETVKPLEPKKSFWKFW